MGQDVIIGVIGLERIIKKYDRIADIDIMPIIKDKTRIVQRSAREIHSPHRRTSNLYWSIKVKFNKRDQWGMVYTDVEYAIYLEFGTYKMSAYPFMRPAMDQHRKEIVTDIRDYLKKEARKRAR